MFEEEERLKHFRSVERLCNYEHVTGVTDRLFPYVYFNLPPAAYLFPTTGVQPHVHLSKHSFLLH